MSAVFTSIPVDKALAIIRQTLNERTPLSPDDIIKLLDQCLSCMYFMYRGEYYLQIHGATMGSPISDTVHDLYMESSAENMEVI